MPATLIGSVSELIERVQGHREEFDISYRTVPMTAMEAFAPIVSKLAGSRLRRTRTATPKFSFV